MSHCGQICARENGLSWCALRLVMLSWDKVGSFIWETIAYQVFYPGPKLLKVLKITSALNSRHTQTAQSNANSPLPTRVVLHLAGEFCVLEDSLSPSQPNRSTQTHASKIADTSPNWSCWLIRPGKEERVWHMPLLCSTSTYLTTGLMFKNVKSFDISQLPCGGQEDISPPLDFGFSPFHWDSEMATSRDRISDGENKR